MEAKNTVFRLTGKVQHYQWGGTNYIPSLLGVSNAENKPFAEYWLGAHVNAPSAVAGKGELDEWLEQHPDYLGKTVEHSFGKLPYLLKVLDVKDMLSIQVHPNKKAAVAEFAAENASGKSIDASDRNYKDDNHKPELMTALSEFWLLHGFRAPALLIQTVRAVPEFAFMLPLFGDNNYRQLYERLMTMKQEEVNTILQPVLDRNIPFYNNGQLDKSNPDFWAARAALTFNQPGRIDRGIFSIYLLNIVHLHTGEAVFQDAGILHAYLEGQNVEIMANSDNVLRGGLTPKHVDVHELMKHVLFEPVIPRVIHGKALNAAEEVFKTPAPDFELSHIVLHPSQPYQTTAQSVDIFLVTNGLVKAGGEAFKQGEAFLATSGTEVVLSSEGQSELYRASVPA